MVISRENGGNAPPIVGVALTAAIVAVATHGAVPQEHGVVLLSARDAADTVEVTVTQAVREGLQGLLRGMAFAQAGGSVGVEEQGLLAQRGKGSGLISLCFSNELGGLIAIGHGRGILAEGREMGIAACQPLG